MVCLLFFLTGVLHLYAFNSKKAEGIQIISCSEAFNNKCTHTGMCSFNDSFAASDCVIECVTQVTLNNKSKLVSLKVKCGSWKDDENDNQAEDETEKEEKNKNDSPNETPGEALWE